jgi:hypothetical protein
MAGGRIEAWRTDPQQRARLRELGSTPRARLGWLLGRFLAADLSVATAAAWADWKRLCEAYSWLGELAWVPASQRGRRWTYVTRRSRRAIARLSPEDQALLADVDNVSIAISTATATQQDRREILLAQRVLQGLFEALVRGALHRVPLGRVDVWFSPAHVEGPTDSRSMVPRFAGSLVARMTLATLDYVKAVGPGRIRRCPYAADASATPCGRLFLAVRRQRYCSLGHTQRAMYLRWRSRGSPRGTRGR